MQTTKSSSFRATCPRRRHEVSPGMVPMARGRGDKYRVQSHVTSAFFFTLISVCDTLLCAARIWSKKLLRYSAVISSLPSSRLAFMSRELKCAVENLTVFLGEVDLADN